MDLYGIGGEKLSILLRDEIIDAYDKNLVRIEPFRLENLGPNSIDVSINEVLRTYEPVNVIKNNEGKYQVVRTDENHFKQNYLDTAKINPTYEIKIPKEGLVLVPGILFLGGTNEKVGSDNLVPMYEGRSSMARLGIQSHISAGFGDIGFKDNWTLEIIVSHPVVIYPNMRIGQVYFYRVNENSVEKLKQNGYLYKGKYSDHNLAQASKSYIDFT